MKSAKDLGIRNGCKGRLVVSSTGGGRSLLLGGFFPIIKELACSGSD